MTTPVGGQRQRLIFDSFYRMVYTALVARGWLVQQDGRQPMNMVYEPVDLDQSIPVNTLAISDEDRDESEAELGSNMGIVRWTMYLDFFAENRVVGRDMMGDLQDILQGRMPSIGRDRPNLPVYDWSQATPTIVFYCDIEDIVVDRAHDFPKPFTVNWYAIRCDLVDEYAGED